MAAAVSAPRWNEIDGDDDAGREVAGIVDWLRTNDSARLQVYKDRLSRFEGCAIPGLEPAAMLKVGTYSSDRYRRLTWNLPRSLCQTVQAKIGGKNRPKVQFVTTGASWRQRRRAYHLDRFAEAQFHLKQGVHGNIWMVGALLLLHALALGDGFAYVYANDVDEQVAVEPVFPWQLFVDSNDAAQGRPRCLFLVRPFDRDELAAQYEEADKKTAIRMAQAIDKDGKQAGAYFKSGNRSVEQIEVIDAWCLPVTKGQPGQHLRYIDGKTLDREDWTRPEFPFVHQQWAQRLQGYWGESLIGEVAEVSDEINAVVQRLSDVVKLTGKATCLYPDGSIEPNDLASNDDANNIKYDPNIGKPEWVNPEPFDHATVEWLRMNLEQLYALPGVSQMAATARKEQGVTAAVALRTIDDMQTERLGTQQNGYELMYVELARHMIACTRELAAKNPNYSVKWPGKSFLREIKWKDVDLPEDQYIMRPDPVSGLKNTPPDRLQLAQDMFGAGIFSQPSLEQSILYLNSKDHLQGGDKQSQLIERYIESWLDATPESLEDGTFKFRSPFPFLNLPAAMLQVAEAFVEAQLDEADDFNLDFFLRWLEQADELVAERAAKQAALNQPPPAPPPPGPGPVVAPPPAPAAPPMAA